MDRKTCLITGASRGIGLACAKRLDRQGCRLALTAQSDASMKRLQQELDSFEGNDHVVVRCDVGDERQLQALFEQIDDAMGRLDAAVVNAGMHRQEPSLDIPTDGWDRLFNVDVRGAMICCRDAAKRMTARGGSIVIVGSIAGERAAARRACYCAAKAAIHAYAQCVALEWAPMGIRINVVAPGPIDTDFLNDALQSSALQHLQGREGLIQRIPIGRIGTPDDVAAAVGYLLSDEAGFITGAILRIDGGRIWT